MMTPPDGMFVYDNVMDYAEHKHLYSLCANSLFRIKGWKEEYELNILSFECIHSSWSQEDIENTKIIDILTKKCSGVKDFIRGRTAIRCIINCCHPGDTYVHHSHGDEDVVLVYIDPIWQREWGGETMFYTMDGSELSYVSEYIPNRVICVDGKIPHSIRPGTNLSPKYRLTISLMFDKRDNDGQNG